MLKKLFPYALVVFLGYVGFSLPLPVLPEMFLDAERSILPAAYSIGKKTVLLGFIIMAYPLGQLFGCPILGNLSDRFGRKKIIIFSLCGNAVGYMITALSTMFSSVSGIFAGLLVCGFSEGNVALAQAVISDLSPQDQKAAYFGWINLFSCLGFIVGPLLGGFLADSSHSSFFTFATPFWMASLLSIFAIFIVYFGSVETRKKEKEGVEFFTSFRQNLKNLTLRRYFLANFFIYLGLYALWRFLPVFLEREFDFSSSQLAYVMAYESFAYALALLFLIRLLKRFLKIKAAVTLFSVFLALMLVIVVIPSNPYSLIWTIPFVGAAVAVVMTNLSVLVSDAASIGMQGQTMGSLQAVQVCAEIATGALGGWIAAQNPHFPLYAGAGMTLIGALLLWEKRS